MIINKRLLKARLIKIFFYLSYYLDIKMFVKFFKKYDDNGANLKNFIFIA